jgi:2-oxoglutarate ferredoxin oxidoreductase subunit gamma
MYFDIIIAGFGGQGVMFIGNLLAYAAMEEGQYVTYMPVYGVEMRGGTANCTVVVSDQEIGSPIIHHPVSAAVMNKPSLVRFGLVVNPGGTLFVNSSLIDMNEARYEDLKVIPVPTIELAAKAGNSNMANMTMLGAVVEETQVVSIEALIHSLTKALDKKYHKMIPINAASLQEGARYIREGLTV